MIRPKLKSQTKFLTTRKGRAVEIEKRDLSNWYEEMADISGYFHSLLQDFKNLLVTYSKVDYARDTETLSKRFHAEGVSFATKTMPALFKGLLQYLEFGKSAYPGFKLKPGCEYPAFLQRLFAPIYMDVTSDEAVICIKCIYQISFLCKKLKGPYPHRVLLKQAEDFVLDDKSLSKVDLDSEAVKPILKHAIAIIDSIFTGYDPDVDPWTVPNPGPGATNTKVEKHMRYEPHVLYTKIDAVMPFKEWFYPGLTGHHVNPARSYRSLLKGRKYEPRSRFCQVDKQVGESRGICIEENEAQFLQQAVKNGLYHWIENHPVTKGVINFAKQDVNGLLALKASLSLEHATIDMSKASDRVLRILVAILFCNQDRLREMLLALSTRWIDFPSLDIPSLETLKYAPMGSALCFPVMAIVHYALCKAIILQSNIENRFALSKKVFVYGDDIVLSSTCAQAVFDWLPSFGMKLNVSKSFVRSHFRESCGLHAYYGTEITPVFLKRIPTKKADSASLLASLAAESQLYYNGFKHAAQLLRLRVTQHYGIMPYVNVKSRIAGFRREMQDDLSQIKYAASRTRKHKSTVDHDYQCHEYRLRVVKDINQDVHEQPSMLETSRYLYKQVTGTRRAEIPLSSPDKQQLVWTWLLDSQLSTCNFDSAYTKLKY